LFVVNCDVVVTFVDLALTLHVVPMSMCDCWCMWQLLFDVCYFLLFCGRWFIADGGCCSFVYWALVFMLLTAIIVGEWCIVFIHWAWWWTCRLSCGIVIVIEVVGICWVIVDCVVPIVVDRCDCCCACEQTLLLVLLFVIVVVRFYCCCWLRCSLGLLVIELLMWVFVGCLIIWWLC